ncbi:MAG: hypothetical protein ABI977_30985 [Acidobacteriota bacterium]
MDTQQLITEIQKLPPESQKQLLYSLARSVGQQPESQPSVSEDEVDRLLLAEGVISEIPCGMDDEEEDFEPIEVMGEPLSEMIIRERR